MNMANLLKITQEKVNLDPGLISRGCFIFNITSNVLVFNYDISESSFFLDSTPKNQAMYNHFVNSVPWEETGIIDEVLYLRSVKYRNKKLKQPTRKQVIQRYENLDTVYEDIKINGYDHSKASPINIEVGADNEIFFCGRGWHRLWICKHLGVGPVQCRIIAKHVNSNLKSTYLEDINLLRFLIGKGMSFIRNKN